VSCIVQLVLLICILPDEYLMLPNNIHPATALRMCLSDDTGKLPPDRVASICIRRHGGVFTGGKAVGQRPEPPLLSIRNGREFCAEALNLSQNYESKAWLDEYRSNGVHPLAYYGASYQRSNQDWPKVVRLGDQGLARLELRCCAAAALLVVIPACVPLRSPWATRTA
jgi:hypothetical protein